MLKEFFFTIGKKHFPILTLYSRISYIPDSSKYGRPNLTPWLLFDYLKATMGAIIFLKIFCVAPFFIFKLYMLQFETESEKLSSLG